MSNLQIGLAIIGGLVLAAVVAYNAWVTRQSAPRTARERPVPLPTADTTDPVADVGERGGRIVAVGQVDEPAQQTLDATGLWVTPGFVDIHTHSDGQVTWDECFTPSIYHGVTTLVMGNCGVGFAPKRPGHEDDLIKLMEGVEDIPGAALHEGIVWNWESFPQYMDVLDAMPHSIDDRMKPATDQMNRRRPPTRSASQPVIGIATALAMM